MDTETPDIWLTPKKTSSTTLNDRDAAAERQEPTPYHGAALNVFSYRLRKHQENGDVTIIDEYRLSKEPLRIDFIVIKKNRDIELEPNWAKLFRGHNIIEYKSPVDKPPNLAVFDKLLGYARLYAAQKEVKISDMTATIVCARTPRVLFKTLKNDFDYEILQKSDGVYYIIQKGVTVEKNLAIQVVVEKSDLLLQALDKRSLDKAVAVKVETFMLTDGKDNADLLGYWFDVIMSKNFKNIYERTGNMDIEKKYKSLFEVLNSTGISHRIRQEGRQEGLQEVFALLEKGCSLSEAKKKLLQNA